MANPWKKFTPLPSTRKPKRDGPLTRVLVSTFIVLFCAMAFGIAGAWVFIESGFSPNPEPTYEGTMAGLKFWFLLGAGVGAVFGLGAAFEAYRVFERRKRKNVPREPEATTGPTDD